MMAVEIYEVEESLYERVKCFVKGVLKRRRF